MVFRLSKPVSPRIATSWRSRCGARAPVSADGSIRLVALLASHLSSQRRLEHLQHCLTSVAAQEEGVDALYLSWGATDALCSEAAAMLEAMVARLPFRAVLLYQREHLSQYEVKALALSPPCGPK